MILFKIIFFVFILFDFYLLAISKKNYKNKVLDIGNKMEKIHSLVKFKNTENIRTNYIHNIAREIQKVKLFIIFYKVISFLKSLIFFALFMYFFFEFFLSVGFNLNIYVFSFLFFINISEPFDKININQLTSLSFKFFKFFEIAILLFWMIYG